MTILGAPPGARPGNYPTLGFDPAPGEPAVVDATAEKIAKVAGSLDRIHDALDSVAEVGGIWEGVAAEAFVEAMGELPEQARELSDGLLRASRLLTGWEGSLEDYQRRAMELERQAAAAKRELDQALSDPALDLAGRFFPDEGSLREAEARYEAAVRDVRMWEDRLQQIVEEARRLLESHQDEASRIAEQLNEIIEAEGGGGLFDAVGDLVGGAFDVVTGIADGVWSFVEDHADFIASIGDVFGTLSTVLGAAALVAGAVALIPPLAPVAGPVAALLGASAALASGVALGAHSLAAAAGADMESHTIPLDAIGALPISIDLGELDFPGSGVASLAPDAIGLAAGVALDGGPDDVIESIGAHLLPDSAGEGALQSVSPAGALVWNAWEEAQAEDPGSGG
ncbi:MAG: hypothetical protein GEV03_18945 [Streptosporangiales bacterium]|nr:hypothetical protein [Streptosporangiales bacterium]